MTHKTGVYCYTNRVNGKVYVGSAAISLKTRFKSHRNRLKANQHDNSYLQRAYNKYGSRSFCFSILERCEPSECVQREQYWIDSLQACRRDKGYNLAPTAGSMLGFRHNNEERQKISKGTKKAMERPEVREKLLAGHARRTADQSWRIKMSKTLRANLTPERRANFSRC